MSIWGHFSTLFDSEFSVIQENVVSLQTMNKTINSKSNVKQQNRTLLLCSWEKKHDKSMITVNTEALIPPQAA